MLLLVDQGQPRARIVISPAAVKTEMHAGEELRKYIHQISGAALLITDSPGPHETNILIGSAAPKDLDLSENILSLDGYVVQTCKGNLVLAGAKPHSALYAVYHFLERYLGCGFFEDGDQVPRQSRLEIGEIHDIEKPRFEWRIYFTCMQDAYSGMRWWDWDQFKFWIDWLVKKRFNMWDTERVADSCGITAFAAAKMGIPMELIPWQKERMALLRKVFDYARGRGVRMMYRVTPLFKSPHYGPPGVSPYEDRRQLDEFIRRYGEKTGQPVPVLDYRHVDIPLPTLDPRSAVARQFISAAVEVFGEQLGTDHLYALDVPSEGGWASDDVEEMDRVTYAMIDNMVDAVKAGDSQAVVCCNFPMPYNKTFETQKRAIHDRRLPVIGDTWLNTPGRLHDFIMCDYYWGQPFTTGMIVACGRHSNPWGDIPTAIQNARNLAADPRAKNCIGFRLGSEINHRLIMVNDVFTELAWNPAGVNLEEYLRQWTRRRYGDQAAGRLQPATEAIASTVYSYHNMDITNGPLYRFWRGGYLPGLTPGSVKRTLSYLPGLRSILEDLLREYAGLKDNPMYRFDLVDYGRTYLAAMFNDRLARARKALRKQDKGGFDQAAEETRQVMRYIAKLCSAHEQFRLQTHDDWAGRWSPIVPGFDNAETNWITFTALVSRQAWQNNLDYMSEDLAEMVEHYFGPRVQRYLQKMQDLLAAGKDISGRLVYRGSDADLPYRINDWITPQGKLPWSPYGTPCEPELTAEDDELTHQLIEAGSVSGKFPFYQGPLDDLVQEILDRYPVPADLPEILSEEESQVQTTEVELTGKPGDEIMGFRTPGIVEKIRIPKELGFFVTVEKLSREYNLMRGDIASYRVEVSHYLKLIRLADEKALIGDHRMVVFEFQAEGRKYLLRYDPGSQVAVAGVSIDLIS